MTSEQKDKVDFIDQQPKSEEAKQQSQSQKAKGGAQAVWARRCRPTFLGTGCCARIYADRTAVINVEDKRSSRALGPGKVQNSPSQAKPSSSRQGHVGEPFILSKTCPTSRPPASAPLSSSESCVGSAIYAAALATTCQIPHLHIALCPSPGRANGCVSIFATNRAVEGFIPESVLAVNRSWFAQGIVSLVGRSASTSARTCQPSGHASDGAETSERHPTGRLPVVAWHTLLLFSPFRRLARG